MIHALWLLSVCTLPVAIILAVARDVPILHVFAPLNARSLATPVTIGGVFAAMMLAGLLLPRSPASALSFLAGWIGMLGYWWYHIYCKLREDER